MEAHPLALNLLTLRCERKRASKGEALEGGPNRMPQVTVAATQMACGWDRQENIRAAERLVREAKAQGAQIVLLQELFETPYFCIEQDSKHFALASNAEDNRAIRHFRPIARELNAVIPISFFERANHAVFNTTASIDADGEVMGLYRKSHLPTGPGYPEKQ